MYAPMRRPLLLRLVIGNIADREAPYGLVRHGDALASPCRQPLPPLEDSLFLHEIVAPDARSNT